LAVFFLGSVIESQGALDLLCMGLGIAAVIAASEYFSSAALLHKSE
jgi:hypothetical protein